MSYRINSTGRKRLLRDSVRIKLLEQRPGLPPSFIADINLDSSLKLDPDARVYIEPYVKSSSMRFDFGTVVAIRQPEHLVLSDIDAGANILFRLKVVSNGKPAGKIIAAADGIRPVDDSGDARKPLLPLRTADIGQEIWRLDVDKDAGPVLTLSSRVPEILGRLKADPLLQGAIYPEVVRQLARLFLDDEGESDEDEAEWLTDWKKWISQVLNRDVDELEGLDDDSVLQLSDDLVEAFATYNGFATRAAKAAVDAVE